MQLHRKVHPPQSHVLHDQRIDPGRDQFAGLPLGGLVDPHSEAVGILHDPGDLLRGVPRGLPRAEPRSADIDRIGAVVHGGRGRSVIFGRS